ncbi:MAG: FAD-dependent oxidoreductase [Bacteroidota bacterium]
MKRRNFIKIGALGSVVYGTNLLSCVTPGGDHSGTDIVVIGAAPAGIMAAIAAARLGSSVTLTEYHAHIGGMSTSGLGKSDIENKNAIAGLFKEFTQRIKQYYVDKYGESSDHVVKCKEGYYYEPSVAEHVFNQMIGAEKNIRLLLNHQLEEVTVEADTIKEIKLKDRAKNSIVALKATVFIDATYEGDVYGLAGAAYLLGREGRKDFNEEHAGKIFFDYNDKVFLEGSTGEGDKKLPACTYRLCLTDDPANSYVLKTPPEGYDRNKYTKYFDDLKEGRLSGPKVFREGHGYYAAHFDTMVRVFSFAEIPNRKFDVNINPRPLGFPFPGENEDYIEAGWTQREKVFARHRNLVLGLLYFVQNDSEIPEAHRKIANQYHLPLDEFTDNGHFPWQLYVREGRRLKGKYVLNENDLKHKDSGRNTTFSDSIIAGEFPIDSFPVTKEPSPDRKVLEGYIGLLPISPYQIPYRILIPEKIKGLIVPVTASTTHVAYSTVRMEPLWMGLGQVAGTAAWLALQKKIAIGEVPVDSLQQKLLEYKQILTYFDDLTIDDKAFKAIQFLGTKGFFDTYKANAKESLSTEAWQNWNRLISGLKGLKGIVSPVPVSPHVSIKQFKDAIAGQISKEQQQFFNDEKQLYTARDNSGNILRGEACMIYYDLYFSL